MRTITFKMTLGGDDEADYADVVAELVMEDFCHASGLGIVSDSAPPAGTPRAVVASSMARADAAGLIEKYKRFRGGRLSTEIGAFTLESLYAALDSLYDAYTLLCATYDDLLAERYAERGA